MSYHPAQFSAYVTDSNFFHCCDEIYDISNLRKRWLFCPEVGDTGHHSGESLVEGTWRAGHRNQRE